ncbi:MAG: hypothetical protein AB8B72_01600 [Crocinitomicaceae bacterium]
MNLLRFSLLILLLKLSSFGYSQQTHEPLPCVNKTFGIIVHIIRAYNGDPGITQGLIEDNIDKVNDIFDSICMSFEICEIRYINNYQYDDFSDNEFELMEVAYNEANRINLYFAKSPIAGKGYATQGGIDMLNSGGIVAMKDYEAVDIAHLLGHYFGLYNTWQDSQLATAELVDGSNCATAGDSICDTPADPFDPFLLITWQHIFYPDFIFEGLDANGDYFNPLVENIMSNYRKRCFFTYGQYRRMVDTWLNSSMKMW